MWTADQYGGSPRTPQRVGNAEERGAEDGIGVGNVNVVKYVADINAKREVVAPIGIRRHTHRTTATEKGAPAPTAAMGTASSTASRASRSTWSWTMRALRSRSQTE